MRRDVGGLVIGAVLVIELGACASQAPQGGPGDSLAGFDEKGDATWAHPWVDCRGPQGFGVACPGRHRG